MEGAMKTGKSFASLFAKARERDAYWVEKNILAFTAELYRLVEAGNLSRADLARRLGTSPAYITKVFRGDVNFTVESMVKLARAAGGMLHIHVAPDDCAVRWFDIFSRESKVVPAWSRGEFRQIDAEERGVRGYDKSSLVA
jgi:transcriptional regulator with XRE-family HTH domain